MDSKSPECDQLRLSHLYEISKLLTRFESVERTIPAILEIALKTLPLESAILILEKEGALDAEKPVPHMAVWKAEGLSACELRVAKEHAQQAYAYLANAASGEALERQPDPSAGILPGPGAAVPASETEYRKDFIVLPLATERQAGSVSPWLQIMRLAAV